MQNELFKTNQTTLDELGDSRSTQEKIDDFNAADWGTDSARLECGCIVKLSHAVDFAVGDVVDACEHKDAAAITDIWEGVEELTLGVFMESDKVGWKASQTWRAFDFNYADYCFGCAELLAGDEHDAKLRKIWKAGEFVNVECAGCGNDI